MQIEKLSLTNVRGFQRAEFEFKPGMNLIVGVNGAGKSTVLDVLRIMLSQSLSKLNDFLDDYRFKSLKFKPEDNHWGDEEQYLSASLDFMLAGIPIRQENIYNKVVFKPSPQVLRNAYVHGNITDNLLAVYFSTGRAFPSNKTTGIGISPDLLKTKQPSIRIGADLNRAYLAYQESLQPRELRFRAFAEWWETRIALGFENPQIAQITTNLETALTTFLPDCKHVQVYTDVRGIATLLIDKGGIILDVRQLSDGERNLICLVLDLGRRLALANPNLKNPIEEGQAVVLIDEIDLHLHPSWQRTICNQLEETFPNCQFIATTHSPQIIGEVAPEKIILIDGGKVSSPQQSLGMDSNWILEHVMNVDERRTVTKARLEEIESLIEKEDYAKAKAEIRKMSAELGSFPELVELNAEIEMIEFFDEDEDEE